jgi:hypothetical protein
MGREVIAQCHVRRDVRRDGRREINSMWYKRIGTTSDLELDRYIRIKQVAGNSFISTKT